MTRNGWRAVKITLVMLIALAILAFATYRASASTPPIAATTVPEVRDAMTTLRKDITVLWEYSTRRRFAYYRTDAEKLRDHGAALVVLPKPPTLSRDLWNAVTAAGAEWSLVGRSVPDQAAVAQHLTLASKASREVRRIDPSLAKLLGKHAFDAGRGR